MVLLPKMAILGDAVNQWSIDIMVTQVCGIGLQRQRREKRHGKDHMQFCLQAVTGLNHYSFVRVWMLRVLVKSSDYKFERERPVNVDLQLFWSFLVRVI